MARGLSDLVSEARARITEVEPAQAKAALDADPRMLVVDVRESEELPAGRLPGALHVPRGVLEPKAAPDSPAREAAFSDPARPVLVYCGSGVRSAFAADVLQQLGFQRVQSLAGGFDAWARAGLPVESGAGS